MPEGESEIIKTFLSYIPYPFLSGSGIYTDSSKCRGRYYRYQQYPKGARLEIRTSEELNNLLKKAHTASAAFLPCCMSFLFIPYPGDRIQNVPDGLLSASGIPYGISLLHTYICLQKDSPVLD